MPQKKSQQEAQQLIFKKAVESHDISLLELTLQTNIDFQLPVIKMTPHWYLQQLMHVDMVERLIPYANKLPQEHYAWQLI